MSNSLRALLLLFICFFSTCVLAEDAALPAVPNLHVLSENILTGGQPRAADFAALKAAGVTTVINLRPESEHSDFNESQLAASLGLKYQHLPIAGAGDINTENAAQLDRLLRESDGKVLVHCASGNRVGALFALRAAAKGETAEQAIAVGRNAGLKSLERVVREKLAAPCPAAAPSC